MKKYILACSAVIFICTGCERESSDTDSTVQESKKWEDVENIGVDPLNEDASGDAQAATSKKAKEEEPSENSKEEESQDHWHDGVWTDDENNESLSAQEKITKDSIEKIKLGDEKPASSSEKGDSVNSKNGEPQDHWHDGVWTDDENNESLDVQEKMAKDSIEKAKEESSSAKKLTK